MTEINAILQDFPELRSAVFLHFNITVPSLPALSKDHLYGGLSTILHNPAGNIIYLSDKHSEDYKLFFKQISTLVYQTCEEFDEDVAEASDDNWYYHVNVVSFIHFYQFCSYCIIFL